MTKHLRPDEFVDAMDGALPAARGAHLEQCAECRAELDGLLSMQREAAADDAPEPSPLFWDHFSARVKQVTADESIGTRWNWGRFAWKPVAALTVAAGALAIGLYVRPAVEPAAAGPAGQRVRGRLRCPLGRCPAAASGRSRCVISSTWRPPQGGLAWL